MRENFEVKACIVVRSRLDAYLIFEPSFMKHLLACGELGLNRISYAARNQHYAVFLLLISCFYTSIFILVGAI